MNCGGWRLAFFQLLGDRIGDLVNAKGGHEERGEREARQGERLCAKVVMTVGEMEVKRGAGKECGPQARGKSVGHAESPRFNMLLPFSTAPR